MLTSIIAENWIQMTPSLVCFGAINDNYGAFSISTPGNIITFKLTYVSGSVNCDSSDGKTQFRSRWGCNMSFLDPYIMGVYITDTNKNRLLPANSSYKEGGDDACWNEYYFLPWATTESDELRFDDFSAPLSVSSGQEYQVWFTEDLTGCSENNNGPEQTCAEVYGLYK